MRYLVKSYIAPVLAYLVAIVAANLIATHFAERGHPEASVYTAFVFIAFDLTLRDRLHELAARLPNGGGQALMAGLILTGSALSYLLNRDAGPIALASCAAFAAAFTVDTVVYEIAARRRTPWLVRANASNVAGAAVDSVVFVALAFPGFLFGVAFGQWTAKVAGGMIFAWLLRPRSRAVELRIVAPRRVEVAGKRRVG